MTDRLTATDTERGGDDIPLFERLYIFPNLDDFSNDLMT